MGKKGKKDKKAEVPAEDEQLAEYKEMSEVQLKEKFEAYQYRLARACRERNHMQLEKDTVNRFYEITQEEATEIDAKLLVVAGRMQAEERDHRVHIRVHEQKVQNLQYEHKMNLSDVQTEAEQAMEAENQFHAHQQQQLTEVTNELKKGLREQQLSNESNISFTQLSFTKNLEKLRMVLEGNHRALEKQYKKQLDQLRQDLDLRKKVEIHEIEERKNQHINELAVNHYDAFAHLKSYYNDITHDNLQLIRSLKDEIAEMRAKEKQNQKKMHQLTLENKQLTEPLAQKERQRAELEEALKASDKDKLALVNLRARNVQLEEKTKDAKTELRMKKDRMGRLERDRDDLQRRFGKSVKEIKRKAEFKNILLEKKMDLLNEQQSQKQAELNDILQTNKLDPQGFQNLTTHLEEKLGAKSRLIKELQWQVHLCTKAYNDTIRTYEGNLVNLGIPEDEIGFELIPTATSTMPAGLVTATHA